MKRRRSRSMPLAQMTKAAPSARWGRAARATSRIACAGTTASTVVAPSMQARSLLGATDCASGRPGRWRRFSRSLASAAACAGSCAQSGTRARPCAATLASATPQAPPPRTAMLSRVMCFVPRFAQERRAAAVSITAAPVCLKGAAANVAGRALMGRAYRRGQSTFPAAASSGVQSTCARARRSRCGKTSVI